MLLYILIKECITQESFFGHFKDEAHIKECDTFEESVIEINEYMDCNNNYY